MDVSNYYSQFSYTLRTVILLHISYHNPFKSTSWGPLFPFPWLELAGLHRAVVLQHVLHCALRLEVHSPRQL